MTKITRTTWNGRKGETYSLLVDGKPLGRRIVVHTWTDTGEVVVSAIKGNAFKNPKGFHQYCKFTTTRPYLAAVIQLATAHMECA